MISRYRPYKNCRPSGDFLAAQSAVCIFLAFRLCLCREQQPEGFRYDFEFDAAGVDDLAVGAQAHRALPRSDDRMAALLGTDDLLDARDLHVRTFGIGREFG